MLPAAAPVESCCIPICADGVLAAAIDRARLRKRKVAPEKIMYYQAKIEPALRATAKYADETETVDHSFDMAEHLGHLNAGVVTIMGT